MKSIPRFFWPNFHFTKNQIALLPDSIGLHAVRVLRLKTNDFLTFFNGSGCEFLAKIIRISGKKIEIEILQVVEKSVENSLLITLIVPILSGNKMDFLIQKATELGAFQIQPILCVRGVLKLSSERLKIRQQHWQSVAVSACEQCGRNQIPNILPTLNLHQALLKTPDDAAKILFLPNSHKTLRDVVFQKKICLLTGAEGGLDDSEIQSAKECGFVPCRLGARILRAETAPIAALAALNVLGGDF